MASQTSTLHPPRLAGLFAGSPSAPGTPVHSIQTMRRKAAGHGGPLTKILVANRGEIAIRVFRTAHELAMHTVAIYSFEDRLSAHRQKSDEAYQVGKGLTPVGAYLAQDDIIRIALEHGVDMIHPGYGFLSENAEFARKVEQAGIAFVGPTQNHKVGVPVVPGTPGPVSPTKMDNHSSKNMASQLSSSSHGRRWSWNACSKPKLHLATGQSSLSVSLNVRDTLEVQLLADAVGNTIHLFRTCRGCASYSLARRGSSGNPFGRHQIGEECRIRNAGTAEFLVDQMGRHYFIEINPRIQVEHTITEEITGIDIVAAQIQIAAGATLPQLGLTPRRHNQRVYRSAGGNGVRLDASSGFAGAQITPHYDSLLVKCTVARRKMLRALVEFRIRGVKTNIPFLFRLLTHDVFVGGKTWTTFIDDTPDLFKLVQSQNRAQKLLAYLGDLAVNGSSIKGQNGEPGLKTEIVVPKLQNREDPNGPPLDTTFPCQVGWRNIIVEHGPEAFARAVREYPGTLIMDTTWPTRLRTIDIVNIAKETSYASGQCLQSGVLGWCHFPTLQCASCTEDPWERLRTLRKLVPNIPLQALVRGANGVGYTSYPDNAIYDFSKKAVENGLDIFRVFDSLNYFGKLFAMKLGIDAAKKAGGVCEAVVCYSGDVASPNEKKYTLQYYLDFVDQLVKEGIHVLGVKDMAGLLKPESAKVLIGAIRKAHPDLPIHVHSHDTAALPPLDCMSGLTSQPSMGAVCMALEQTNLGTGIRYEDIQALNLYWSQVRMLYSPFEANVRASDSSVFDHEMPGGQYTNLMFQAAQLGLGTQWTVIKQKYIEANDLCGNIIKVTPSSKVVGDFAQWMTSNSFSKEDVLARADQLDFPSSVVEFFQGYLGQPVGGFPEPLRTKIIRNKPRIDGRPGATMQPLDFKKIKAELRSKFGKHITDADVTSYVMYPKVFEDYQGFIEKYGDLSVVPTRYFLGRPDIGEEMHISIEPGKTLIIRLMAVGPVVEGRAQRDVWFEVNGEVRAVSVEDKNSAVETVSREKATSDPGSVGAPMSGVVVEVRVKEGQEIKKGDPVCVLIASAQQMESAVTAPVSGHVKRVVVQEGDSINQGDLTVEIVH
ncbi:pyruvate carboxylase [Gymnopilus junonius]|uniref:Pyruvate carboxylase n=1 Tax=Gymnopilus junonius TaxID=109634 RepID=A0A9P5NPN6_GYMJU|nr:pyruvate carboxylase [Gymnopilus junonius]